MELEDTLEYKLLQFGREWIPKEYIMHNYLRSWNKKYFCNAGKLAHAVRMYAQKRNSNFFYGQLYMFFGNNEVIDTKKLVTEIGPIILQGEKEFWDAANSLSRKEQESFFNTNLPKKKSGGIIMQIEVAEISKTFYAHLYKQKHIRPEFGRWEIPLYYHELAKILVDQASLRKAFV